jgi:hypothetical protein
MTRKGVREGERRKRKGNLKGKGNSGGDGEK